MSRLYFCEPEIPTKCKVSWWKIFGEDEWEKYLGDESETPANSMNASSSCTKMIESLGEEEKKKKLLRFIVEPCIIIAVRMEEIHKIHIKLEKLEKLDWTFSRLHKVKEKKRHLIKSLMSPWRRQ